MITRLQLGVARLEGLDSRVLERFVDPSWIHLGDTEPDTAHKGVGHYLRLFRKRPGESLVRVWREVTKRSPKPKLSPHEVADLYRRTTFREFYFHKGGKLDFEDESFDYVFSEHFFNHLFFDEAISLFRECRRVLKPHGAMRVVVPDADLRTYEPAEAAGYPDPEMSFLAPFKHKTRWSVYMLTEALRLTGFEPVPLRYCNRKGEYIRHDPREMQDVYRSCSERVMVFDLGHVMRLDSLIVDGLKRPA